MKGRRPLELVHSGRAAAVLVMTAGLAGLAAGLPWLTGAALVVVLLAVAAIGVVTFGGGFGGHGRGGPSGRELEDLRRRNEALDQQVAERGAHLAAAEERMLLLEEVSSDAVLFHDGERILLAGGGVSRLFGYGVQELVRTGAQVLVVPESRADLARAMSGEGVGAVALVGVRKNGTRFPVEARSRTAPYRGRKVRMLSLADVTDRRAAEAARRSVEGRFRLLFDEAPIGMGLVDLDGRWLQVNKALCAFVGREPAELLRTDIRAVTYPDDVAEQVESLRRMAAGDRPSSDLDTRYVRDDGCVVSVHMNMSTVLTDDGRPRYFILQVQDVTPRKAAEEALRTSEERYRQIVELANEGIWIVDAEGRTTFANTRMAELLGYPVEEMTGLPVQEFTGDLALFTDPAGVATQLGNEQLDFEFRRADGTVMWAHVAATPVVDAAGRSQGAVALVTDVTARRWTEEELRDSEGRFRRLAENATDVIYRIRIRPTYCVEYMSPAITVLTGHTPEEYYADPELVAEMIHPDDRLAARAFRDASGPTGGPALARFMHVDGSVRWTEHRLARLKEPGGGLIVEGIGRDVTDRVAAQERLRQVNEELEAASRHKTEFLAVVSHELRSPLNSLMILAELLARDEPATLTEEQGAWATAILGAGRDVAALVSDVLDLAKIEAGEVEVREAAMPVAETVEAVVALLGPQAGQRGIELRSQVDPALPAAIRTDRGRVSQILRNLVSNGVKFTPAGSVEVRAERRAGPDGADEVAFAVADTGIGITRDKLEVIFEAFRQGDASATRRFGGTGLGLSISMRLAARLGGRVEVDSVVGQGSTFTLVLPLRAAELPPPGGPGPVRPLPPVPHPRRQHPQRQHPDLQRRPVVLVVEDDPGYAYLERIAAGEAGWDTLIAQNGERAVQLAATEIVDAVVLDISLPDMSGVEVLERLRATQGTAGIPAVFVSGFDAAFAQFPEGARLVSKPDSVVGLSVLFDDLMALARPVEGPTLLLVDDDARNLTALAALLTREGFRVLTAPDAAGGIALLVANPGCRAVLMDIMMPDMDGYEATRRIRTLPGVGGVPIVALTAKALSGEDQLAYAAGMNGYLTKPLDVRRLLQVLDEIEARGGSVPPGGR